MRLSEPACYSCAARIARVAHLVVGGEGDVTAVVRLLALADLQGAREVGPALIGLRERFLGGARRAHRRF